MMGQCARVVARDKKPKQRGVAAFRRLWLGLRARKVATEAPFRPSVSRGHFDVSFATPPRRRAA